MQMTWILSCSFGIAEGLSKYNRCVKRSNNNIVTKYDIFKLTAHVILASSFGYLIGFSNLSDGIKWCIVAASLNDIYDSINSLEF